ncbi:hypothetical protein HMN09_00355500 [Mycena chlorophos]|uniref:F-box domain-containing protein n=1 Tax=Mycena chlorophos TaxID=658473 RepID=A0A8H6TGV2_MYCCL|nr:hypothetical protein HMN09_00355500 [Mycena chlorophos]
MTTHVFSSEIVHIIASHLSTSDLLTLCCVSRAFRTAGEAVLYRFLDLKRRSRRCLQGFLSALENAPRRASLVKILLLGPVQDAFGLDELARLGGVLKRCDKLSLLNTSLLGKDFGDALSHEKPAFPLLKVYCTSPHTLKLPIPPPALSLLVLHLGYLPVISELSTYRASLHTLVVIMHGICDVGLPELLGCLALALPKIRRLCICPSDGWIAPPNVAETGSLDDLLSSLTKFEALDSLLLHLRADKTLTMSLSADPRSPDPEPRAFHLGYPPFGNPEDSDSNLLQAANAFSRVSFADDSDSKPASEPEEQSESPIPPAAPPPHPGGSGEPAFGRLIMKSCSGLRRLDLGVQIGKVHSGPQVYVFERADGEEVSVQRYRKPELRGDPAGDSEPQCCRWGWKVDEEVRKWC